MTLNRMHVMRGIPGGCLTHESAFTAVCGIVLSIGRGWLCVCVCTVRHDRDVYWVCGKTICGGVCWIISTSSGL